jgi:predicted carbohydrate-binding protein with CBM5 and CBM33 domain
MAFGGGAALKRIMAGAIMLLALILFAPTASAHAHGMASVSHATKTAGRADTIQSSLPGSSKTGCDDSSSCCLMSQCVQDATVCPAERSEPKAIRKVAAAYAVLPGPMSRILRSGPATPPPRLDA